MNFCLPTPGIGNHSRCRPAVGWKGSVQFSRFVEQAEFRFTTASYSPSGTGGHRYHPTAPPNRQSCAKPGIGTQACPSGPQSIGKSTALISLRQQRHKPAFKFNRAFSRLPWWGFAAANIPPVASHGSAQYASAGEAIDAARALAQDHGSDNNDRIRRASRRLP